MTERVKRCPSCNEPIEAAWRFCPVCATALEPTTCPECGTILQAHWKRCPACGRHCQPPPADSPADPATTPDVPAEVVTEPVTGMALIRVPAGRFDMGDTFDDGIANETPVHEVALDAFYIGRCPVTQAQWQRVMPDNPSRFADPRRPVESVDFAAVQAFLERLNRPGTPGRFDLPSEAQWEYAARSGGRRERYAGGDDVNRLAWYADNSDARSQPVGLQAANGLGLHDMSGNVWEWCRDTFRDDAYAVHEPRNPVCTHPAADRVIRGGGWNLDAWSVRCARRFSYPEPFSGPALGFRVVLEDR